MNVDSTFKSMCACVCVLWPERPQSDVTTKCPDAFFKTAIVDKY